MLMMLVHSLICGYGSLSWGLSLIIFPKAGKPDLLLSFVRCPQITVLMLLLMVGFILELLLGLDLMFLIMPLVKFLLVQVGLKSWIWPLL